MSDQIGIAILAAGEGKRMGTKIPKPLIPLMGRCLVDYPLEAGLAFAREKSLKSKVGVVVGHGKEKVKDYLVQHQPADQLSFPVQEKQLGTGHALKSYFEDCKWAKDTNYTVVLCADTPLLTKESLSVLWEKLLENKWDAIAASFFVERPKGYGRILQGTKGFNIVEEKDATAEQRKIKEVNSGLYIFKTSLVLEELQKLDSNNKAGEFYLTDVFKQGAPVGTHCFEEGTPFFGVNNPIQLEQAMKGLQKRINQRHQENGVLIMDSQNTYIEPSVILASGTTIFPGCYLHGNTIVGEECVIEPGTIIKDSKVGKGVKIKANSYLEEAVVAQSCQVGPYARLRPGTDLSEKVKIGNFVEVKKSKLEKDVSVSHLSYVGDAEIGENVNIGCGFITCNYDGESKHKTIIGKNSFIGSDTQMIAPVKIGESVFVASGSTINQDVPNQGFSISRGRQIIKEKLAVKFLKGKWSLAKK